MKAQELVFKKDRQIREEQQKLEVTSGALADVRSEFESEITHLRSQLSAEKMQNRDGVERHRREVEDIRSEVAAKIPQLLSAAIEKVATLSLPLSLPLSSHYILLALLFSPYIHPLPPSCLSLSYFLFSLYNSTSLFFPYLLSLSRSLFSLYLPLSSLPIYPCHSLLSLSSPSPYLLSLSIYLSFLSLFSLNLPLPLSSFPISSRSSISISFSLFSLRWSCNGRRERVAR